MKKTLYFIVVMLLMVVSSCKFMKPKKAPIPAYQPEQIIEEEVDTFVQEVVPVPVVEKDVYLLSEIDEKYLIIVGSFQNLRYAKNYANKYKELGFETKVISKPNGYYMVSAKSFDSQQMAYSELKNFRKTVVRNSWVFINKRAVNQNGV